MMFRPPHSGFRGRDPGGCERRFEPHHDGEPETGRGHGVDHRGRRRSRCFARYHNRPGAAILRRAASSGSVHEQQRARRAQPVAATGGRGFEAAGSVTAPARRWAASVRQTTVSRLMGSITTPSRPPARWFPFPMTTWPSLRFWRISSVPSMATPPGASSTLS